MQVGVDEPKTGRGVAVRRVRPDEEGRNVLLWRGRRSARKGPSDVTDDTGQGSAGPQSAVDPAAEAGLAAPRRGLRLVVGGVVLTESLLLGAATVVLVVEVFRQKPAQVAGALAEVVVLALLGFGLFLAWRAVVRADPRARTPVLVWQVLQVAVGVPALSSWWYLATLVLVPSVLAGVGVLVPGVLRRDTRRVSAE